LSDLDNITQWSVELQQRLNADRTAALEYIVVASMQDNVSAINVRIIHHGVEREVPLNKTFFDSGEYRSIRELGDKLDGLLGEHAYIQRGDRKQEISSFKQALAWLMEEANRGQTRQRYKGLGEMNPDQLWDTTVNPETRRLLQVRIEDAVAADEVFTTLMGDQVEPRREFIERNALSVSNLDV
jgi:DNA gyrase subunit B